jgi:signal transduction histidine kinase
VIRGEAYGNLYLAEKEGGEFDAIDEQALVILAEWAGIAIENARLYEGVEQRRVELERAVQTLEATTTIALAVGGEIDLDRVLELIVKRGRALVEARALVILLEEGGELVVAATAGDLPGDLRGARVPVEGSVGGEVLRSGHPERLADVGKRLRFTLGALGVQARTGMFVPLLFRGRALGVLEAFDRLGGTDEFGVDDERLMLSFAASAATAVATAQTVQEDRLRDTLEAAEQERGRWARELHDETLQGLAAMHILLSTALRGGDPEQLNAAVIDAVGQLGSEIENLRALIAELRPAALDELGLRPAIEALAERARTLHGVVIETAFHGSGQDGLRLAPELESMTYRLVQEALTNIAKHARAEHASIEIQTAEGVLSVTVTDDGEGIDEHGDDRGFGLIGMRERVVLAGGQLDVRSAPGQGTTVYAEIPLRYAEEPAA